MDIICSKWTDEVLGGATPPVATPTLSFTSVVTDKGGGETKRAGGGKEAGGMWESTPNDPTPIVPSGCGTIGVTMDVVGVAIDVVGVATWLVVTWRFASIGSLTVPGDSALFVLS